MRNNLSLRRATVTGLALIACVVAAIININILIGVVAGMALWAFLQNVVMHDDDATRLALTKNWDITATLIVAGALTVIVIIMCIGLAEPLSVLLAAIANRFELWLIVAFIVVSILFIGLLLWSRRRTRV